MADKHADEHGRKAVDYVLGSEGKSTRECAREPGPNDKTLSHWVSSFRKEGRTGSGMTEGEREVERPRRENERPGTGSELPKEASAFFAGNQRQRSDAC